MISELPTISQPLSDSARSQIYIMAFNFKVGVRVFKPLHLGRNGLAGVESILSEGREG